MSNKSDLFEQEASFEQEDVIEPVPPADIVAYNELRSCADLFRLHSGGKLEIKPDFQREVVWKGNDQSRFIDSLVKQLPIPSMCFSLDHKTQRWKVIDGLQRMSSIIRFFSQAEWRLGDLQDIHPTLRGATNQDLRTGNEDQRRLYSLVEDVSIPVTVIRCDYTQKGHMRYLFTIFHRLNSGGMRLTNQEIRNCIYTGWFNTLLKEFDRTHEDWKYVKKRIWGGMDRFRSVEVLLRVMAFGDKLSSYDGNLARFLNDYMAEKTQAPSSDSDAVQHLLSEVASKTRIALACETQRKISLTVVEALLVGLYANISSASTMANDSLQQRFIQMKQLPTFSDAARYAISSVENVKARLTHSISAFSA